MALPWNRENEPALFCQLGLAQRMNHQIADLRDAAAVKQSIRSSQPDFVFHLAAQALVRRSFEEPAATYMTNVAGTVYVLEALREVRKPCAAVFITTDKCYENREWLYGYCEEDPLGGFDPYSSSKAAAEIAIASCRLLVLRGSSGADCERPRRKRNRRRGLGQGPHRAGLHPRSGARRDDRRPQQDRNPALATCTRAAQWLLMARGGSKRSVAPALQLELIRVGVQFGPRAGFQPHRERSGHGTPPPLARAAGMTERSECRP